MKGNGVLKSLMKRFMNFDLKTFINTIIFNFRYFPFKTAIKFPIFVSSNVYIQKSEGKIILDCPIKTGIVKIGFGNVDIFDKKRERTIWTVSGTVIFKGKARFGCGSRILVGDEGVLTIGKDFRITAKSSIIAFKNVEIGYNTLLSWDILILDTDFHKIMDKNGNLINKPKKILIGDNVWIGCRNLILKGSRIPNNSVIAAGSIVNNELKGEGKIFGGNPIKVLRNNVTWEP